MKNNTGIRLIAIFKIAKGLLMIGVSFGIFRLIHADLELVAYNFLNAFRVDPDNSYIRFFLEKFIDLSPDTITKFGIAAGCYSVLLLTEGFGLWFEQKWAQYLVIVASSIFIPVEVEKLAHHFSLAKVLLLLLNLAIVGYLCHVVTSRKEEQSEDLLSQKKSEQPV
jgi:uncharacterized membrane protein (DUF2068 family)